MTRTQILVLALAAEVTTACSTKKATPLAERQVPQAVAPPAIAQISAEELEKFFDDGYRSDFEKTAAVLSSMGLQGSATQPSTRVVTIEGIAQGHEQQLDARVDRVKLTYNNAAMRALVRVCRLVHYSYDPQWKAWQHITTLDGAQKDANGKVVSYYVGVCPDDQETARFVDSARAKFGFVSNETPGALTAAGAVVPR